MNILSLNNVSLAFGGPRLLDEVNFQIASGERICLLGRNGAGKSTLLHLLNGNVQPDSGGIIRRQHVNTSFVPQDFPTDWSGTIRAYLLQKAPSHDAATDIQKIDQALSQLDLDPEADLAALSGGQKRRVLLAVALSQDPDLILLDEPTNHLDIDAIRWLENFLLKINKALVFVSHDRAFARTLATRVVELDRGRLQDYRCDYKTFLERRQEVLHAEEKEWARFDQKLAEEEVWIRKGIKARRTRNMGRVRDLQKMREERRQRRERTGNVKLKLDEAPRSGQMVIEADNLNFAYPGQQIIKDLNLRIMRGDRIGLIGPNGTGKTTLIKLLTGRLSPTSGRVKHGTNLHIAYFDQLREQLDEDASVKYNIAEDHDQVIIQGKPRHIYGYLQDFLFTPERARTPVRVLSGGEKNRLLLAKLFTQPANLLILDEPTNDLDMETLDLLEELILDYQGTVLLVSHDRSFLNNIVTSSLIFEGSGQIEEIIGGYDDLVRYRKSQDTKHEGKTKASPLKRKERPRKLGFKEKRELAELPAKIEDLEGEQVRLHEQMANPELYKEDDGARIALLKERLQEIEAELEQAYQRWEELDSIPE